MGIKDLNSLINCFEYIEKSKFKGELVGLDFFNFWYISHSKACKEEIYNLPLDLVLEGKINQENIFNYSMKYFMEYLFSLARFDIIPLVIFEGRPFELKNKYALVRRSKDRQRSKERLQLLEEKKQEIKGEEKIKLYRNLIAQTINFDKKRVIEASMYMLDRVGLPWLHCITEAEHLGTALCREGYTIAFYTTDTDVLPLGCPFTISREGTPEEVQAPYFKTVKLQNILKDKGISLDQFQDICILSSCDYNERIKLKNKKTDKEKSIGIKTALQLIKEYGSFSALQENEELIDVEKLEYPSCKNIFQVFSVKELCPDFALDRLKLKKSVENLEENDEKYLSMLVKNISPKNKIYDFPPKYLGL